MVSKFLRFWGTDGEVLEIVALSCSPLLLQKPLPYSRTEPATNLSGYFASQDSSYDVCGCYGIYFFKQPGKTESVAVLEPTSASIIGGTGHWQRSSNSS